ncbi:Protein ROOT INITIATION DEFECTIVE 3 [Cardamine amara subsp. amara]|uniref:Protein ROOT INITIATION DEFECTIVE 3 n=1 Tax=Cardamine amara subsp. amara TaxID=228776 RepID=A0ABD0ZHA8_CARAN
MKAIHEFLAAYQLHDVSALSSLIFYWSWHKPQVEVRSFPVKSIKTLAANNEETYIVDGGFTEKYLSMGDCD